jgi:hypothetical protein
VAALKLQARGVKPKATGDDRWRGAAREPRCTGPRTAAGELATFDTPGFAAVGGLAVDATHVYFQGSQGAGARIWNRSSQSRRAV